MSSGTVPYFRQETAWSCSVACLRMVLARWGAAFDEDALRACCHTTTVGTRADDVVTCAKSHGFDAEHVRGGDTDNLHRWLASGASPIVLLNMFPIDLIWRMHAVVIIGLEGNTVQFLDPAHGQRSAGLVAFEQAWQMNLSRAILVLPAGVSS
jgi:ABC-type bacteriocin/lantibiotic exporter with double-glycine peptidase domain